MKTYQLEDASQLAAKSKYTFYKPSQAVIDKIKVGECVKLIFSPADDSWPSGERMWVQVCKIEHGNFAGRLVNKPVVVTGIKFQDHVDFQACHIIATQHDGEDPAGNLVDRFSARCFVSNRILRDGARVGFLSRDEPLDEDDSGWFIPPTTSLTHTWMSPAISSSSRKGRYCDATTASLICSTPR